MARKHFKTHLNRVLRLVLNKSVQILLVLFALSITASAQEGIHKLLLKRSLKGVLPKLNIPVVPAEQTNKARKVGRQQVQSFHDRVWFPGEWEEVKAVVVTVWYQHCVPGHEDDTRYAAIPIVPGYASRIYQETEESQVEDLGFGPFVSKLDLTSVRNKVFLSIMDGIQKGGAEAWVRIEKAEDENKIRKAMEDLNMTTDRMRFFVSEGNDFWFRDCGPICFYYGDDDNIAMLDFLYDDRRQMDNILPKVLHAKMGIPNFITNVVWEGGNCLVDGVGGLMTSSAVYEANGGTTGPVTWYNNDPKTIAYTQKPALTEDNVEEALGGMVGQANLSIVDRLYADGGTGHIDLYADATDESGFMFAKMPDIYKNWGDYGIMERNVAAMFKKKSFWNAPYINWGDLPFPAKDDGSPFESEKEYHSIARTYANHLMVNNYILQPCFSPVDENHMPTAAWDRANIELMKKRYPGYTFYCIDMRCFDGDGGSIHCVTKQIPADNPVRILHYPLYDKINLGTLKDVPFSSIITNKSGIAKAQLNYCVGKDGQWKQVDMTSNGNRWYCNVPASTFTNGQTVNYYISATSKNGKTITKPVNAAHGDYYDFVVDNTVEYTDDAFDFSTEPIAKEKLTFNLDTNWLEEDTTPVEPPTGIVEVSGSRFQVSSTGWYDMFGRKLNGKPTQKGVYILDGKAVAIE